MYVHNEHHKIAEIYSPWTFVLSRSLGVSTVKVITFCPYVLSVFASSPCEIHMCICEDEFACCSYARIFVTRIFDGVEVNCTRIWRHSIWFVAGLEFTFPEVSDTRCLSARVRGKYCDCLVPYIRPLYSSPRSHLIRRYATFIKELSWKPKNQLCHYSAVLKGKAVPLQAWTGPDSSRKLRFPDFMTTTQDGCKVVSLTHRPPLPPGNKPGTHFY